MNDKICKILELIEKNLPQNSPAIKLMGSYKRNPYTILMVTLLSLRSKDEKTAIVAKKLFNTIQNPNELLKISKEDLEKIIKPIGMQKQKANTLLEISKILVDKYSSKVPNRKDELLSLKGIGEKTVNIVLNNAFNKGVIAVDTHVHRICNLLNIIDTKNNIQSSKILNEIVPKECKEKLNFLIVSFGQTICTSNPKCEICFIKNYCKVFDE